MDSLSEIVDVVIGVDTHIASHSAAALNARTGGVLGQCTIETTPDGYAALVAFAEEYGGMRAWAIEGTGGHGAGLTRHLHQRDEFIVELDRPERAKRRHGAKSDPLDAIRAAREALSRTKLGTPRSAGERQALSVLLAAPPVGDRRGGRRRASGVLARHRHSRGPAVPVPGPQGQSDAEDRSTAAAPPGLGH